MTPNLTVLRKQYPFKITKPLQASDDNQGKIKPAQATTQSWLPIQFCSRFGTVYRKRGRGWQPEATYLFTTETGVTYLIPSQIALGHRECIIQRAIAFLHSSIVRLFCLWIWPLSVASPAQYYGWLCQRASKIFFQPTDRVGNGRNGQSGKRRNDLPYHCSTFTRGFCVIHAGSRWIVISL